MNIIIFDTETIGKVNQDLINIGYKIIDLDISNGSFKTLQERDYLITRFINNKDYCLNDDFVGAQKYGLWLNALENKKAVKRTLKQVFKTLENDIKKFKVLCGYAYNCKFDVDKFMKNGFEFNIPIFDIWGYASKAIINTYDYYKWAIENNQLTESERYISSTVESVTRYLNNDLNFKESHTALDDVQYETQILVECFKRGVDITKTAPTPKRIESKKVFTKTIKYGDVEMDISYTKSYERNGTIIYKW